MHFLSRMPFKRYLKSTFDWCSRQVPIRSVRPGDGVRLNVGESRRGTIGAVVRISTDPAKKLHALTAQHVLTDNQAQLAAAPGDGTILRKRRYGKLRRLGRIAAHHWHAPPLRSPVDGALIEIEQTLTVVSEPKLKQSLGTNPMSVQAVMSRPHQMVQKIGFKTGHTFGAITALLAVRVTTPRGNDYIYPSVYQVEQVGDASFAGATDSGSLVWTYQPKQPANPVGLLVRTGGEAAKGRLGYVIPIEQLIGSMGIELVYANT
jgi:hypothetical protein